MNNYKAIIFDLGKVIIDYSLDIAYKYWADNSEQQASQIQNNFIIDEKFQLFEKGKLSADKYIEHIAYQLKINQEIFLQGWNSIFTGTIKGIPELVNNLKNKYRIVALSNTNIIHYPIWKENLKDVLVHFEEVFTSHSIGHRKPEKEAFQYVLNHLNLDTGQVVFLDDMPENISAARKMGIESIQVASFEQMRDDLNKLKVI